MESNLILVNQKEENKKYNGKYFFQYGLIDKNNEYFPLTDYIESETCNIYSICSEGYYINIKNDRREIKTPSNIVKHYNCISSTSTISEIQKEKKLLIIEKLYLLISNFREKIEANI